MQQIGEKTARLFKRLAGQEPDERVSSYVFALLYVFLLVIAMVLFIAWITGTPTS